MNSFYLMSTNLNLIKEDKLEIDQQDNLLPKNPEKVNNNRVIYKEYFNNDKLCSEIIKILYNLVMVLFFLSFLSKSNILMKLSKVKFFLFATVSMAILLGTSAVLNTIVYKKYEDLYLFISYMINLVVLYYLFPVFLHSIDFRNLYGKMRNISSKMNHYNQSIANIPNQPIVNRYNHYNQLQPNMVNYPSNNQRGLTDQTVNQSSEFNLQLPNQNIVNNINEGIQKANNLSNISAPHNNSSNLALSNPLNNDFNTSIQNLNNPVNNFNNSNVNSNVLVDSNIQNNPSSNVNSSNNVSASNHVNSSSNVNSASNVNPSNNAATQQIVTQANINSNNGVSAAFKQHQFNK